MPSGRWQWLVWFFDASKQAFAGVLQHFVNLAFGVLFARSGRASECSWYLVNFTISVGCGVVILWAVMKAYNYCVDRFHLTLLRSGEYGSPPSWRPWLAQMLIWGFFASSEKGLTALVVIMPLHASLDEFAAFIEMPLLEYPALELLLVMVIAPVLLNMFFFWVIDNIIMRKRQGLTRDATEEGALRGAAPAAPSRGPHGLADPCLAGGDEDDRPTDDKQPLLEGSCGCCPPFSPQTPQGSYQPAATPVASVASRCRCGGGGNAAVSAATEVL